MTQTKCKDCMEDCFSLDPNWNPDNCPVHKENVDEYIERMAEKKKLQEEAVMEAAHKNGEF